MKEASVDPNSKMEMNKKSLEYTEFRVRGARGKRVKESILGFGGKVYPTLPTLANFSNYTQNFEVKS